MKIPPPPDEAKIREALDEQGTDHPLHKLWMMFCFNAKKKNADAIRARLDAEATVVWCRHGKEWIEEARPPPKLRHAMLYALKHLCGIPIGRFDTERPYDFGIHTDHEQWNYVVTFTSDTAPTTVELEVWYPRTVSGVRPRGRVE